MSDTTGYNGWTNYETWVVKLWMDNEEGSYLYVRGAAQAAIDHAQDNPHDVWTEDEHARFTLEEFLKTQYEETLPELDGPWCDLLGAAFSRVNWLEIARNIIDEIREDANV